MNDQPCFADQLNRLMEELDISGVELSLRTGITGAGISKIVNNKTDPYWTTAQKIMKAFPEIPFSYWTGETSIANKSDLPAKLNSLAESWTLSDDVKETLRSAANALIVNKNIS